MASQFQLETIMKSAVKSSEIQITVVLFLISILVYKILRKVTSDEKPPPPGPWGFPILGHLPLLGKEPNVTFMKMRQKFGDIFQIRMGRWPTVVVNGKRAIREALKDSGYDFSGRTQFLSSSLMGDGESLSFGKYSDKWRIHRKIANKVLFEFSNAKKNPIQEMVYQEVDVLVKSFTSHDGRSFDPKENIKLSVASIIYQICYGREQNIRDSADFGNFLSNSNEFVKFVSAGNPVDIIPLLRYIMPSRLQKFSEIIEIRKSFRNKRVEEHRKTFSPDNIRDVTDGLLSESMEETRLSEERIVETIDGLFGAGMETVATTLRWAFLLMAAHPDIQKQVHAEFDEIVGDGRRPVLQDRGRLVYTEAVLHEINRFTALVSLAIPHSTTRDTHLGGYSIKKDTVVFMNLYSMSHDKDVWGDPDVFRPERFLDDSGEINKSLLEEFFPFSIGNRKCLGELLARMEVFLFFTGILQRCTLIKPAQVTEYSMDIQFGLTRHCLPYEVQVQLRN